MAKTYASLVSDKDKSLLVVTFTELAVARKAIAEPELAARLAREVSSGHPSTVMAQALVTYAPAVAIEEWQRSGERLTPTGKTLEAEAGLDHVLHNFGQNNQNRRIWLDKGKAAEIAFSAGGPAGDPAKLLSGAIQISQDRHIDMDLRKARVSAQNFGATPSAKSREAAR